MPEHSTVILCSNFDELTKLVCCQPLGHKGVHRAIAEWGDEGAYDPYADPTHGERNDAD